MNEDYTPGNADYYDTPEPDSPDCDCDEPDFVLCPVCGSDMERVQCWRCQGAGGFHNCGEDCCMCLDKEEITESCSECDGLGGHLICIAAPHADEQMAEFLKREATNGDAHVTD